MDCEEEIESSIEMDKSVIVVGAGFKGLYCSRLLSEIGFKVTLLERSNTAGGKIETIRSPTGSIGSFAEMGAMRVLESDTNMLQLLKELSISLIPFIEHNENAPFSINNITGKTKDLNLGLLMDAGLVDKDAVEKEDGLSREMTFDQILDLAFEDAEEISLNQNNESMKIGEFLKIPGKGEFIRKCANLVFDLRYGKNSLGKILNPSIPEFLRYRKHSSEPEYAIEDGYDSLINCLISELSKKSVKIILESEAILVEYSDHSNVKVTCRKVGDEQKKVYSAHFVLLTSPCLQNLEFKPELPQVHLDMIHRLLEDCVPAMKSVLRFDECFWQKQEHGGIIGGTCSVGPSLINQIRLPPFYCKEDGYIMIYLVGEPVNEWLNHSEEERINTVLEAMEKLFPSIEGRIREHFKGMSEAVCISYSSQRK